MGFVMPSGLHRTYGAHHLHFITSSCYRRLPFLRTARSRDAFLAILEQKRDRKPWPRAASVQMEVDFHGDFYCYVVPVLFAGVEFPVFD
jgi:hypothetical protein